MQILLDILVLAFLIALGLWLSPGIYHSAYAKAQAKDLAFFRAHPDCTWEDAHRHRERVRRLFLRP